MESSFALTNFSRLHTGNGALIYPYYAEACLCETANIIHAYAGDRVRFAAWCQSH
jgi:hypothetical protein